MDNFRLAVKSLILKDGSILVLRRRKDDAHRPDQWDIPGGRLEPGENPFLGLKREVREETGLDIEILLPLDVHHFMRDDGQRITMIIFLCRPLTSAIQISHEHQEYHWAALTSPDSFPPWVLPVIERLKKYRLDSDIT